MSAKTGKNVICDFCGKDAGYRAGSRIKPYKRFFCSTNCSYKWNSKYASGKNHSCWIEGYGKINNYGYKVIHNENGKLQTEQRVVAAKVLGRELTKNEIVHHINGNKLDNRNENLLICSRGYHQFLHGKMSQKYQEIFLRGW